MKVEYSTQEQAIDRTPMRKGILYLLYAVFFASGMAGLIYEISWTRVFALIFGNTTAAVSMVLAGYMAGLCLGSYIFGRIADRMHDHLKLYAWMEAGIGFSSLIIYVFSQFADEGYIALFRLFKSAPYLINPLRFVIAFAILLAPMTLIGGSLPVLTKYIVRKRKELGAVVGKLYGVHTAGAVAGSFLAGFILLRLFGSQTTIFLAVLINFILSSIAWILWLGQENQTIIPRKARELVPAISKSNLTLTQKAVLLISFSFSGFAALGYQVLWTRSLVFVFGNSVYAFSAMLTVFLLGLAIGGYIFSVFFKRRENLMTAFAFIEMGIGLSAAGSLLILKNMNLIIFFMTKVIGDPYSWTNETIIFHLGCATMMLIPTILMGITFPLVVEIFSGALKNAGWGIGTVYAFNTIGAILGSLIAGFVIAPIFGVQTSIAILAFINVLVGTVNVLVNKERVGKKVRSGFVAAIVILPVLYIFLFPGNVLLEVYKIKFGNEIVYWDEGPVSTVLVTRINGLNCLSVDGLQEVPPAISSRQGFRFMGHLPPLLNTDAENALVVALGGGIALGALLQHDVESVDCVEIVKSVPEAAKYFSEENQNALQDPRLNLVIQDGRNFVLTTRKTYDIILIDSTHPKAAESWILYTREFYSLCKEKLNPNGIICQWLPMNGMTDKDCRIILNTFQSVYPFTTVWLMENSWTVQPQALILGTPQPFSIDVKALVKELNKPGVKESLEVAGISDPAVILSKFLLDENRTLEYISSTQKLNTDDLPYLRYAREGGFFPTDIFKYRRPITNYLKNLPEDKKDQKEFMNKLETWYQSAGHSIKGNLAVFKNQREEAISEYRKALMINPEDFTAREALDGILKGRVPQH